MKLKLILMKKIENENNENPDEDDDNNKKGVFGMKFMQKKAVENAKKLNLNDKINNVLKKCKTRESNEEDNQIDNFEAPIPKKFG